MKTSHYSFHSVSAKGDNWNLMYFKIILQFVCLGSAFNLPIAHWVTHRGSRAKCLISKMEVCSFEHSLWHSSAIAAHELDLIKWCQLYLLTASRASADSFRNGSYLRRMALPFFIKHEGELKPSDALPHRIVLQQLWLKIKTRRDKWMLEMDGRGLQYMLKNILSNGTWLYNADVVTMWWTWAFPWPLTPHQICLWHFWEQPREHSIHWADLSNVRE